MKHLVESSVRLEGRYLKSLYLPSILICLMGALELKSCENCDWLSIVKACVVFLSMWMIGLWDISEQICWEDTSKFGIIDSSLRIDWSRYGRWSSMVTFSGINFINSLISPNFFSLSTKLLFGIKYCIKCLRKVRLEHLTSNFSILTYVSHSDHFLISDSNYGDSVTVSFLHLEGMNLTYLGLLTLIISISLILFILWPNMCFTLSSKSSLKYILSPSTQH